MRLLRDQIADEEQRAEDTLRKLRAVIVALDALIDDDYPPG